MDGRENRAAQKNLTFSTVCWLRAPEPATAATRRRPPGVVLPVSDVTGRSGHMRTPDGRGTWGWEPGDYSSTSCSPERHAASPVARHARTSPLRTRRKCKAASCPASELARITRPVAPPPGKLLTLWIWFVSCRWASICLESRCVAVAPWASFA